MAGKPEKAIESLVNGRVRKFLEETVLLNQAYIKDPSKTVAAFVNETKGADIVRFVRFRVGEMQAAEAAAEGGEGASS
jgi:elongation factor Ts